MKPPVHPNQNSQPAFKDPSFILIFLAAAALCLLRINDFEMHADWSVLPEVFKTTWPQILRGSFYEPTILFGVSYPPLYFALCKLFCAVFGNTVLTVRVFSVLGFLLSLILTRQFLRSYHFLFRGWTYDWTLLALAVSPALIWQAQIEKYFTWLFLFTAAALISGLRLITFPSRRTAAFYAFSAAAVFYTHYIGALFLTASAVMLLGISLGERARIKYWFTAHAWLTLLSLPILFVLPKAISKMSHHSFGEHVFNHQLPGFFDFLKAFTINYVFSPALRPSAGGGAYFAQWIAHPTLSLDSLNKAFSYWPVGAGTLFVAGMVILPLLQTARASEYKKELFYLCCVGPLTLLTAWIAGLVVGFHYFNFITWPLIIGFGSFISQHRTSKIVKSAGILYFLLCLTAFAVYYPKIQNKYPGLQNVDRYLRSMKPEGPQKVVYADDWVTRHRMSEWPVPAPYTALKSHQEISAIENGARFFLVLPGSPESARNLLARNYPEGTCSPLQFWPSLEAESRSLGLFECLKKNS